MTDHSTQTALVTGANSGLGLEAAAQLADRGYGTVIITARTDEKAETARDELRARTGKDVFEVVALDFDDLATARAAVAKLAQRGTPIDVLLLNAGMAPPKDLTKTTDGLEATVAATLVGHHLFTLGLLDKGLVAENGRIVIAGSEAARGDVPTFNPVDIDAFAAEHFGGDAERAIEAQIRMDPPAVYKSGNVYATAKVFVVWWAAELAGRLPAGATVNTVSPGSTPNTNAARNAPFYMRKLMMPILKILPGMSHSVADGAGRYIEGVGYGDDVTGRFFASKPKKMTGDLVEIQMDHFDNPSAQKALWSVTSKLAGVTGERSAA